MENFAIKVDNRRHGKKVKAYFKSIGITSDWYCFDSKGSYYGLYNGDSVSMFTPGKFQELNIKEIKLPKTKNNKTMEHVQTISRMAFKAFVITMLFIIWSPNAIYGLPVGIITALLSEAKILSGRK